MTEVTTTETPRPLQFADVVSFKNDGTNPIEIVGCIGYVIDATLSAAVLVRVYQPKTVGENAEYSEYTLPSISLNFIGPAPADLQPNV